MIPSIAFVFDFEFVIEVEAVPPFDRTGLLRRDSSSSACILFARNFDGNCENRNLR